MSNEILEKQIEGLKSDLATAKADATSLKDEISNQKDEEIQAQIETFEATLAEKDQAETLSLLTKAGEAPWIIGHIQQNSGSEEAVVLR